MKRTEKGLALDGQPCKMCRDDPPQRVWTFDMCSDCKDEASAERRRAITRECRTCGNNFTGGGANYQKYGLCSEECERKWAVVRGRRNRARRRAAQPVITPVCEHCGDEFEAVRSDARFCSGRCRVAAHRATARVEHLVDD